MKKLMTIGAVALVSIAGTAQAETKTNKLSLAERQARYERKVGGYVLAPKSYQGTVAIVNRQSRLDETNLVAIAELFESETRCRFRVTRDAGDAVISLTVIDDPKEPTMLLAPEDRWGKVNLAKLVADLPSEKAQKKFFASRARKTVVKALSILCGGAASSFPGNVMNATTARELDELPEQIPFDMGQKYAKFLPQAGVTPKVVVPYYKACREGWAPAPTNDIQKAVWDKVRAMPKNPMKIEFDPKKGR